MQTYKTDELLMDVTVDEEEGSGFVEAFPGDDQPVAPYDGLTVIQFVTQCKDESEEARYTRDRLNEINQEAAHCRQDFTGKVPGQSTEFVPKVPMALEQLAAFVKRGLVGFGNYFSVEITPNPSLVGGPLTDAGIVKLMRHRLEDPEQLAPGSLDFPTSVSDGVKIGALEAQMIFKVCGTFVPTSRPVARPVYGPMTVQDPITGASIQQITVIDEELVIEGGRVWRLLVELIRPEDYFPDPTGRGLYEILKSRRDLYEVIQHAEAGEYDLDAIEELVESYVPDEDAADLELQTDQPQPQRPDFRKEVEIWEFWGTILDSDGHVVHRNCRCVVANKKFLIRAPEPNPYWHQESPFVAIPLLRVPFSVFHKALFDYAVRINLAMNELYNLIVDGGMGAVWGVRQVKMSHVENAEKFSDGIPAAATLIVSEEHPDGVPVLVNTPTGVVPQEALAVYQLMDKEFSAATMLSTTAMGQTPRKEVSATATASADQSSSMFFDSVIASVEAGLHKVLRLAWLTMLQNVDDWGAEDTAGCIGPEAAAMLAQMSPARRYATYAQGASFRVNGLSSMLARTREFQKVMAFFGAVTQSPILSAVAQTEISPFKLFYHLLKSIGLDPEEFKITPEEMLKMQEFQALMQQSAMLGGMGAPGGGGGGMQMQNSMEQLPGSPTQEVQATASQLQMTPEGF